MSGASGDIAALIWASAVLSDRRRRLRPVGLPAPDRRVPVGVMHVPPATTHRAPRLADRSRPWSPSPWLRAPAARHPRCPPASVNSPAVMPAGASVVHPVATPPPPANCTASDPPPSPMPTPGHMPAGSWMAHIHARGYLIAGVDQNTYLWAYRDPATGQLQGFDIDMLEQVNSGHLRRRPPADPLRDRRPTPIGARPWRRARSTSWPRR